MSSTQQHKITQLMRHSSSPSHTKVESEYKPSPSGIARNQSARDTQRVDSLLENEYRRQYSCPPSVSEPERADPRDQVAAYVLQTDGTMAAVRWDDKSALESSSSVLSALKEEQQAQMYGRTTGRIHNTHNSKVPLHPDMLNWLASDEDSFSSHSGSSKASEAVPSSYRPLHQSRAPSASANSIPPPISQNHIKNTTQYPAHMKTTEKSASRIQSSTKRNNLRIISSSAIQQQKPVCNNSSSNSTSSYKLQFSPPASGPNTQQTASSTQVQESYWSPQISPVKHQLKTYAATESTRISSQQRQLSVERAPRQQLPAAHKITSPAAETSVWEYFKSYEHCATSDF